MKSIYVAGSMRNPRVPQVAKLLREQGFEVFDDWYSPGEQSDDKWQEYEKDRGRTYAEALDGHHAKHVFELDHRHLKRCDVFVLVMPAGKSAHIELGWFCKDKPAFVLFDKEPERYDIMYRFVYETGGAVVFSDQELLGKLGKKLGDTHNTGCDHQSIHSDHCTPGDCDAYARQRYGGRRRNFCDSCKEFYKL